MFFLYLKTKMFWKSWNEKKPENDDQHENEFRDLNKNNYNSEKKKLIPETPPQKKSTNCCTKFFKCIFWTLAVILILLILLIIVLLVLYGAQGWAAYKSYKVAKGLYLSVSSNNTSFTDVAKGVYSLT